MVVPSAAAAPHVVSEARRTGAMPAGDSELPNRAGANTVYPDMPRRSTTLASCYSTQPLRSVGRAQIQVCDQARALPPRLENEDRAAASSDHVATPLLLAPGAWQLHREAARYDGNASYEGRRRAALSSARSPLGERAHVAFNLQMIMDRGA